MDGTALIIIVLAIAGVVTITLYVLKGVLDQLPDVFDSAGRARDAWDRLTKKNVEEQPDEAEETPPARSEDPPAAA
ncbi:hypothetical protein L1I79_29855 [Strepomyces sp. STD 3.1]|nr:hypothetical protein [Streptomyces sp. STD 3.1]